jgi:hypothetical protein
MKAQMKTFWSRIGSAVGSSAQEPESESRREQIVKRQRELAAASVQSRLSHQYTDPPVEEAARPLYDSSVYSTSTGGLKK